MNPLAELRLFVCAVQLLTRLPTPRLAGFKPDWINRAARYYPLAGQLVGALAAAVLWLSSRILGGALPAILAVATAVLMTGGFHEDGLADTFDGLGGGHTAERRLEIMKDSRIGSYGALALGLVTALRIGALSAMRPEAGAMAFLFAGGAARAAAALVMGTLPYARAAPAAKLAPADRPVSVAEVFGAVALSLWPALLMNWRGALAGLALAAVSTAFMAQTARRLIGGYTGDVLGAVEQLAEAALLVGAAAAWPS